MRYPTMFSVLYLYLYRFNHCRSVAPVHFVHIRKDCFIVVLVSVPLYRFRNPEKY